MSNEQDKKTKDRVLNEKFHPFTRACYEGMKADRASEPTVTDYDRMMDQQLNLIEAKTGKPIRLTPEQAANWLQWLQSRLEDHLRLDEVYRIEFQQCKVGDLCPDGSMVIEVDAQQQAVSPARIVATGLASWLPTAEDLAIDTSSWRVGDLFSYTNEYDREFDSRLCTLLIIDSDTEGNTAAKFGFDNARTHWAVTETMLSYYTRMTEDNNHDPQD